MTAPLTTVTRKSAETEPLHRTDPGRTVARCGETGQRAANRTEQRERLRCFTCDADAALDD